jgi:hypothetical protein
MEMTRGQFLQLAAVAGIAVAAGSGPDRRGMRWHGVGYEVTGGETPSTGWDAGRMRTDLHAIKNRLGASSISVFGDGVSRLAATAAEAAVAISEFGSCTFEDAPAQGGLGWRLVEYTKQPPEVADGLVRSEQTQADYLIALLDVFESMSLYAAIVYNFVTPDAPHQANPRYDYDMVSYGIVKPLADGDTWHWEPKAAFRALARRWH